MEINRKGTTTEYKIGHHYLTYTVWEDGHCEIEVHKCTPELIFHSCDMKEFAMAEKLFKELPLHERKQQNEIVSEPKILVIKTKTTWLAKAKQILKGA